MIPRVINTSEIESYKKYPELLNRDRNFDSDCLLSAAPTAFDASQNLWSVQETCLSASPNFH